MAMSHKFCEHPFDWSLLVTCLDQLNIKWNPEHVYKEEVFGGASVVSDVDRVELFRLTLRFFDDVSTAS